MINEGVREAEIGTVRVCVCVCTGAYLQNNINQFS